MGRNRKRLQLLPGERAELMRLSHSLASPRDVERLKTVLLATDGAHTLEELAQRIGRSRATIQNWLGKFGVGRIAGLLERRSAPGAVSPLAGRGIQSQLRTGLKAGRWNSAAAIAKWLEESHGVKRSRKSIYYWLRKNGWGAPGASRRK